MSAPLVLSIGTTHPRNVAGLGLDARIAADYGARHAMVVAGVSAQDEAGVRAIFPIPADVVQSQLTALALQEISAIRVGALGTLQNAQLVAQTLENAAVPAVFDPVMRASAGGSLYASDALDAVLTVVQRARAIVTPNLEEAAQLARMQIDGVEGMIAAGRRLLELGARAALVKGGHLAGDPVDVLVSPLGVESFRAQRIAGKTRGTGCTLAMALACELARGHDLVDAVKGAREYVRANLADRI